MVSFKTSPAAVPTMRRHLSRFLIVGIGCVALDLAVYVLLDAIGLGRHVAKAVGFISGMMMGFVLNKIWTFSSRRPAAGEAVTYFGLYVSSLLVNVGLNALVLRYGTEWFGGATAAMAFVIATGICTVLNFIGMRFVTFRRGITEPVPSAAC